MSTYRLPFAIAAAVTISVALLFFIAIHLRNIERTLETIRQPPSVSSTTTTPEAPVEFHGDDMVGRSGRIVNFDRLYVRDAARATCELTMGGATVTWEARADGWCHSEDAHAPTYRPLERQP